VNLPFELLLAGLAFPSVQEAPAPALFVEAPKALDGVSTTCGSPDKNYIIEVNGGGLALEDFDRDGDIDVLVVDGSTLERLAAEQPGFPPRLFLNDGSGTFTPAGEAWRMAGGRWGFGVATGDVNGDGWPDVVVTQWGPTRLFLNQAGRGFKETTETSGLAGERWGSSAALFDYDGDGHLDLAQINYLAFDPKTIAPRGKTEGCTWKGFAVMCGPEGLSPVHDLLYRGKGDGTFEDVTAKTGFRPAQAGFGLGAMPLDFDSDGDTDLFVTNDSTPNFLWENKGDGTFAEVGYHCGVSHDGNGKELANMGIGCGDVSGDGRPDLLVTTFSGESSAFFRSLGARRYREESAPSGLGGPSITSLGWGTALADLDLDGDLDAYVLNGHVYPVADKPGTDTTYAQANQLFRNDGKTHFRVEPLSAGPPRVSRAGALGDLDGDGDLDLVAIELGGPVRVFLNSARSPGMKEASGPHWLRVRLVGRAPNTAGLGARVRVEWEGGARTADLHSSGGFQAAVPAEIHVGLGSAARVKRLVVRWPGGREQVLEDVAADRVLTVEEPAEELAK
jgi:enediyne biosynthesis protein E4